MNHRYSGHLSPTTFRGATSSTSGTSATGSSRTSQRRARSTWASRPWVTARRYGTRAPMEKLEEAGGFLPRRRRTQRQSAEVDSQSVQENHRRPFPQGLIDITRATELQTRSVGPPPRLRIKIWDIRKGLRKFRRSFFFKSESGLLRAFHVEPSRVSTIFMPS